MRTRLTGVTMIILDFDTETHNAGREYDMEPRDFVRLFQYSINDGPVQLTTDYDEMLRIIRSADLVSGHNIIASDLYWLFGKDSTEPLEMALQGKILDTYYLANLVTPAPDSFKTADGRWHSVVNSQGQTDIGKVMTWLGLGNLTYQFDLPGKLGDLKDLAKKHNPPKTLVRDLDYGLIPLDDPEFLAYAEQDVIAVQALRKRLKTERLRKGISHEYVLREMAILTATVGQMRVNGILVNQDYALERIKFLEDRKNEIMAQLVQEYGFPTEGKAPWASAAGKNAIMQVLAAHGITPETVEWPLTKAGKPSLSKEALMELTEGTDAVDFAVAISTLAGQRSVPQQFLDNMKSDGRVHPDVTSLQRSGRWSMTKPGITVIGERDERLRADKDLVIAAEGNVIVGFDFSNADARAVAALSGDEAYAKRFDVDEDGNNLYDGHNLTGEAFFGDLYYQVLDAHGKPALRGAAKAAGLATNYNIGANKLAVTLNKAARKEGIDAHFWAPAGKYGQEIPQKEGQFNTWDMLEAFNQAYPKLKKFKDAAVAQAEKGAVWNAWGRRMPVAPNKAFTQGPALLGQSTTREMMADAILRLVRRDIRFAKALRAIVHDELILELSEDTVEDDIKIVKECMEAEFYPEGGMPIVFTVGYGYGKTWKEAGH